MSPRAVVGATATGVAGGASVIGGAGITPVTPPLGTVATVVGAVGIVVAGSGRVGIARVGAPPVEAIVGADGAVHPGGLVPPCAADSGTATED